MLDDAVCAMLDVRDDTVCTILDVRDDTVCTILDVCDDTVCAMLDVCDDAVCAILDMRDDVVCSTLDVLLEMAMKGFSVGPFRLFVPLSAPPQPLNTTAKTITMNDELFIDCKLI
jgi:hypothetical protein